MNLFLTSTLLLLSSVSVIAQAIRPKLPVTESETPYVSKVWVSDLRNGTYKNPVLNADYSDLDACRAGDDYYLVASSFDAIPGLPILHSKDLVNWTLIKTSATG